MKRLLCVASILAGCGPELPIDQIESNLNASERLARCEAIRDTARERGLFNGALLGGIGDAETNLAHCWSEATWACQGPDSDSCGGGPVIAGAGDGPCSLQEGGLGLFQFDGGTFDETLARDGEAILLLEGNISHAVDFVIAMVKRSTYVDVSTDDEAIAWMNSFPIELGHPDYEAWVSTVTHYYNGCTPSAGCWEDRRARYDSLTRGVYGELGPDFWMTPEPEPCVIIPPEGRIIEETETCYVDEGPTSTWRTEDVGHGGRLRWTYAWDDAEPGNFAFWNLDLAIEGTYRVEVYLEPGEFSQSQLAAYQITHAGSTDVVTIDQSAAGGFVLLGEFFFAAGGDQAVRLDDNTGEPLSAERKMSFDALRVTPMEMEPDPDPDPDPKPDAYAAEGRPVSGIVTLDRFADEPRMMVDSGGCTCAQPRSGSTTNANLGLTALLLAGCLALPRSAARRRASPRRRPLPDRT